MSRAEMKLETWMFYILFMRARVAIVLINFSLVCHEFIKFPKFSSSASIRASVNGQSDIIAVGVTRRKRRHELDIWK